MSAMTLCTSFNTWLNHNLLPMAPLIPLVCLAFANIRSSSLLLPSTRKIMSSSIAASATKDAISSLPPLNTSDGASITKQPQDLLKGKRVALYFAAGWCPMCTSFEPSLLKFREAAKSAGKDVEIIYVPSDRSEAGMLVCLVIKYYMGLQDNL